LVVHANLEPFCDMLPSLFSERRQGEILAGAQLPFGGHKGSNIAAMVELLSAALFGTDLAVDKDPLVAGAHSAISANPDLIAF
jgi:LDH2 family malate/lactate/ureidoglycolate dehydrogenase